MIPGLFFSKLVDLAAFGSCWSAQLLFTVQLLATGLAHLGSDTSENMVAHFRLGVSDGVHWTFVMKKALNLAHAYAAGNRAPSITNCEFFCP